MKKTKKLNIFLNNVSLLKDKYEKVSDLVNLIEERADMVGNII